MIPSSLDPSIDHPPERKLSVDTEDLFIVHPHCKAARNHIGVSVGGFLDTNSWRASRIRLSATRARVRSADGVARSGVLGRRHRRDRLTATANVAARNLHIDLLETCRLHADMLLITCGGGLVMKTIATTMAMMPPLDSGLISAAWTLPEVLGHQFYLLMNPQYRSTRHQAPSTDSLLVVLEDPAQPKPKRKRLSYSVPQTEEQWQSFRVVCGMDTPENLLSKAAEIDKLDQVGELQHWQRLVVIAATIVDLSTGTKEDKLELGKVYDRRPTYDTRRKDRAAVLNLIALLDCLYSALEHRAFELLVFWS
ncbi:hypothetical protein F66182_5644 [Fusarium sp. NRRL 66182]|nr:hypothetical protein F66182_5644 [Fusarium sp. NRRL 66182]